MPVLNDSLTVSQFVELVNVSLEPMTGMSVTGEVGQYKVIQNKWVTFTLKDSHASVGCFMTIWQLRTQIEDGMMVRVTGQPRLREKGFFSFVLSSLQPAGEGALKRAFLLLQQKLEAEGIFSQERKRKLPDFPEKIALITSRDAAAYSDFVKVLKGRQGGLSVYFLHTQVQGKEAPDQIIRALEYVNTNMSDVEVVVIIRGGGSLEDLHAFNDERVIRAVASSRTPTIVGIGHERDVTLAELAADLRASTPSNAAELLVKSREEIAAHIQQMVFKLKQLVLEEVSKQKQVLENGATLISERMQHTVRESRHNLEAHMRLLFSLSPELVIKRGFSVLRDKKGKIISSVKGTRVGDQLTIQVRDGHIQSLVEGKKANE